MDIVIQTILPYLLLYKYVALFGLTFIAAFILPIPPGTLIMASAAFASQGYFGLGWVLVVSMAGNVSGDNASYWFSRYYGYPILSKLGLKRILDSNRYAKIEKKIKQKSGWIIFLSRFEVSINLIVNIISGIGKISYRKFLIYSALGEILQVTVYGMIGYLFGSSWQLISSIIGRTLLILIILGIIVLVVLRKRNKREKQSSY